MRQLAIVTAVIFVLLAALAVSTGWLSSDVVHNDELAAKVAELNLTGPAGPQGPTGPQGERGLTGETGPQGAPGTCPDCAPIVTPPVITPPPAPVVVPTPPTPPVDPPAPVVEPTPVPEPCPTRVVVNREVNTHVSGGARVTVTAPVTVHYNGR